MPIFPFESKNERAKKEILKAAKEIANEATRRFDYKPNDDPVIRRFRKRIGLPSKNNKSNER